MLEGWLAPSGVMRFSDELDVFVANSRCLSEDGLPMGRGLFNWRFGFPARSLVAEFSGQVIGERAMEALVRRRSVASNYCVQWEHPGEFLSCYGHYLSGRCWASFINSPFNARDDPDQRAFGVAQNLEVDANSQMEAGYFWIAGEMRYSVQVWTTRAVRPGEELLMLYAVEGQGLYHPL